MNKTISITLAGMIFHIEEDGYHKLQEYLEAIRKYFLEHDNSDEVMEDIETSIAEKFSDLLTKSKQVISSDDVEEIISVMGDVTDYQDPDAPEPNKEQTSSSSEQGEEEESQDNEVPKKLYRNPDDVVIAGVCSGLAAYMGIDPVIMRVAFVASLFFGGAGILIYIILWLAMPDAKTSSQKLEMQGKRVTIKKLETIMKEKIEPKIGDAGNLAKRAVDLPFRALASVFRVIKKFFLMLGPALRLLIAFVIVLSTAVGIFFVSLLSAVLVFNLDSELITTGYNLEELSQIMSFNLAVAAVWVIALIPLLFILLVGLAIWSKRNVFSFVVSSTLLGVWMLAIIVFTVIAIDASPRIEKMVRERAREDVIERTYEFSDFSKLEIQNAHDARIVPGDEFFVKASGREYDLDRLDLQQRGDELVIANEWESGICLFCFSQDLEFEITCQS